MEETYNKDIAPIICEIQSNLERNQNNYVTLLYEWGMKENDINETGGRGILCRGRKR